MSLKEKVCFPSENKQGACPGVLTGDTGKSSQGLVVLQEWWGMNEVIVNEAADISERGNLVTLVPDLYRGKVATDHETAGHYMSDLDWPGAVQDICGAAKYLKERGCSKVGVTGFCMGGALALASAALIPEEISAAAPFYGIPSSKLCDLGNIKIPVQAHFGSKDTLEGFSSPKDVEVLKEKFDAGGVPYELFMYDTGHAFTNPTNPSYTKEICDLALGRMIDFMKKYLQ
ncbi:PREDICTED: protein usf-like [Acropora digitifera]|uniref:protein usf-like n=1 Tax=Acropora digitifera TaxID=70779 RepID=UPI00077AFC94|nr:PREDICTED: protein usf-like [Acropora digitifera]